MKRAAPSTHPTQPKANLQAFRKDDEPPSEAVPARKKPKAKQSKRASKSSNIRWTEEEMEKVAHVLVRLGEEATPGRVRLAQRVVLPPERQRSSSGLKGMGNLKTFLPVFERVRKEEHHHQPHLVNGA